MRAFIETETIDPGAAWRAALVQTFVAHLAGVPLAALLTPERGGPRIAFARQVAMYLAHVACGLTFVEVAQLFGRTRTTAAYACHRIEKMRDDPWVDWKIARLEEAIRCAGSLESTL